MSTVTLIETKQCSRCQVAKPLKDFSADASAKDGLNRHCKPCHKLYVQEIRLRDDEQREQHRIQAGCQCSGCKKGLSAETPEHFERWAYDLTLDNGKKWRVEDFQLDFITDLLAKQRGTWLYPEAWLIMPEGNAKSTLTAGIAMHHAQHTRRAAVGVAAAAKDQAAILVERIDSFVSLSDGKLRDVLGDAEFIVLEGRYWIRVPRMQSVIRIYSSDDRTGDGIIPTFLILEELHRHRDLSLYRTWMGKTEKRDAQAVVISTAGEPGGEFEDQRELMKREASDVTLDETFTRAAEPFGHVIHDYSIPDDADPEDLDLVAKANPLKAITKEKLAKKRRKPSWNLAHWRRFTCGLPTRAENAAITESEWFRAKAGPGVGIPEGQPVGVGLDVAWKWDTTAAVPMFCPTEDLRIIGEPHIIEPPRNGDSMDPAKIEIALTTIHERNPIHTLVMDTSRAEQLGFWAQEQFGCEIVDRGQSNTFAVEDYDRWMEALRSGWLRHPSHRELTKHVMNAVARMLPGGDTRFDRPVLSRSDQIQQKRRVIDGLTAASMIHTTMSLDFGVGTALVSMG